MINNILNTVFVRIFNAGITLGIVILNSNVIGAEGLGNISLIVLATVIFILLTGFVSGALIFFVPRENTFQLVFVSYFWTFLMLFVFFGLTKIFSLVNEKYVFHVFVLSVLTSGVNINEKILAGKEKIKTVNFISLIRTVVLASFLLFFYFVMKQQSVLSYVYSLYFSLSTVFLISFSGIIKYFENKTFSGIKRLFIKVIKLGTFNTLAASVQKLNYRLAYYFIEYYSGIKVLGIFSAGVQISESVLILSRSISFVLYSKVSNIKDKLKSAEITVSFIKLIFILSSSAMLILSVFPPDVYAFIFGKEFSEINIVIFYLSPGIVAVSLNLIIMHFFSGTGNQKLNMYSATAGFVMTVFFGLILIPEFGLAGGAIASSLSYVTSAVFQFWFFLKISNFGLSVFKIEKNFFKSIFNEIKKSFKK